MKFSEKRFACFPEALSRRRNILFQPTAKDLPRLVNPFLPAICRSAIDIFVAKYIFDKTYITIEIFAAKYEYFCQNMPNIAGFIHLVPYQCYEEKTLSFPLKLIS